MGYARKGLEKGYLEHPGVQHVSDFRPFWTVAVLLAAFCCQQAATMSAYKFTQRAVASPDAPQKPLVRKIARSGGAEWVRVSRRTSASPAKKPPVGGAR